MYQVWTLITETAARRLFSFTKNPFRIFIKTWWMDEDYNAERLFKSSDQNAN